MSGDVGRDLTPHSTVVLAPIVRDLTPHSCRHCGNTWMEDDGIRRLLVADRMGHTLGDIGARYTHITPAMRAKVMEALTALGTPR